MTRVTGTVLRLQQPDVQLHTMHAQVFITTIVVGS